MKPFACYALILYSLLIICPVTNLQAQDNSYYKLDVKNIAPKTIKFTNKCSFTVKVIIYKGKDNAMAVGLKTLTIKPGKSANYKIGVYNVKIYKAQLVDKYLKTTKNISGNLQIYGSSSSLKTKKLTVKKPVEFRNNTGEKIKICLYKRNDKVRAIPFETYTLTDNTSTAFYSGDEASFFVSVFNPALLDKLLVSQICPYQSIITVTKVK